MKRFLLVVACIVCVLAVAAPAKAATLGFGDLIGTIINGAPANLGDETLYAQKLIDEYRASNNGPGNYNPPGPINETWQVYNLGSFGVLPDATGGVKDETGPFFPIDLTSTSYEYLYAKFGGYGALFSLDDYPSIEGIDTSGVQPAGIPGGGLSHVTLFNPTKVPEPMTLMLLGFGLAGVGTLRRFKTS